MAVVDLPIKSSEVKARGNWIMSIISVLVPLDHITATALLCLGARGLAAEYNVAPAEIKRLFCDWVVPTFGHPNDESPPPPP